MEGYTVYSKTTPKKIYLIFTVLLTIIITAAVSTEFRRINCYPEADGGLETVDQQKCEARGCIYLPPEEPAAPVCFIPQDDSYGYIVLSGPHPTELGQRWLLQRKLVTGPYGDNFENVTFETENLDNHLLRMKFDLTGDDSRFKVPLDLDLPTRKARNVKYDIDVYSTDPFKFRVTRLSTGTVMWDTDVGGFTFSDKFLQFATLLPTDNVYGFGENNHNSFRHDINFKTWPMWTRDQAPWSDDTRGTNLYSSHPFYQCMEDDGQAHGVFLLNSNAMDYTLTPAPMLVYKTIGGILDFYMFLGPTPENVVQQYTSIIGRPYMPPYWSLGFQLCRYGYLTLDMMKEAVTRTLDNDIPLDVLYGDIDYMDHQRIFTVDPINYVGFKEYFDEMRSLGLKTIIILDPVVEINETYEVYTSGRENNVYIQWPDIESMPEGDYDMYNRLDMMGYVWPEWISVFPDFFNDDAVAWWDQHIEDFRRDQLAFDGLWLDMNEPANFGTNEERPWNWPPDRTPYWSLNCTPSEWDDPPYRTAAAYTYDLDDGEYIKRISTKTLCMQGVGLNGGAQYRQYDVHSLYGLQQTIKTLPALRRIMGDNKRSIIVTRSTFAGAGKYSGRWLGDNASRWPDLHRSIIGMLEFNLFGFPYIGADICGFFENTTAPLCRRWQELGAFYPYSRNHNQLDNHPQDPGFFGDEVVIPTRATLRIRYTLLPFLYTLFHRAHVYGDTVVRPLMHEFYDDKTTWNIDRQFLWGPSLLISPVLEEDATSLEFYYPDGQWYDYYTKANATDRGPYWNTIDVNDNTTIQLHLRGGYILPTQEYANNTHYSRQKPFGLKVPLSEVNGNAYGELFWDDGQSIDTYQTGDYFFAHFQCERNILEMIIHHNNVAELDTLTMGKVEVMGVSAVTHVYVNQDTLHTEFTFDESTRVLEIENLNLPMNQDFTIEWRNSRKPAGEEQTRLDCCPESSCDPESCQAKGCLWTQADDTERVPWCHINTAIYGYKADEPIDEAEVNAHWLNQSSMFGGDLPTIKIERQEWNHVYHIKIFEEGGDRYEVPVPVDPPIGGGNSFEVIDSNDPYWSFQLRRNAAPNTVLLDTAIGGLTFADQFLQFATLLPSKNVYGLGENLHPALLHDFDYRTWPLFTRDQPPSDYGNLYGVHPFYLCVEDNTGHAHGYFLLNSNAMEVSFLPTPAIVWRTTGGILDMYVLIGASPEEVIQRYSHLIGYPYMPPYWALGFHLSRYGFDHIDNMQAAVNRTLAAEIPLDVIHMDIDTFDARKDFTWDKENFAGLPEYISSLQSQGMSAILILDPFLISNETDYRPYELGLQMDTFIKWPPGMSPDYDINGNDILLGWCWPDGRVVYPDYFKDNTSVFWSQLIEEYHQEMPFDGIWLDMNEPANFGTNEDRAWNWPPEDTPYWTLNCSGTGSQWDLPPYKPNSIWGQYLSDKTICMSTLQNDGQYRHYDVHSLYGWGQSASSLTGLRAAHGNARRGVLVTRSTYAGSGKESGHWLGDNASIWPHLKDSIVGMIEFGLFGIPFIGADICGYFDDAIPEMCLRWQQLGAFYPFSRNHNGAGNRDQDPGAFGPVVAAVAKETMLIRYTILPYMYTLFYHSHDAGLTVVRPLFFEFSENQNPHIMSVDHQFMLGRAFLISPVLRKGKTDVNVYIPYDDNTRWFNYYNGDELDMDVTGGRYMLLTAPMDYIPLHVRGGFILPTQQPANTTKFSRRNSFGLIVAPSKANTADGDMFWDDGETIDTIEANEFCILKFSFQTNMVNVTGESMNCDTQLDELNMDTIRVFGVAVKPSEIHTSTGSPDVAFVYDDITKELVIEDLKLPINEDSAVWWS